MTKEFRFLAWAVFVLALFTFSVVEIVYWRGPESLAAIPIIGTSLDQPEFWGEGKLPQVSFQMHGPKGQVSEKDFLGGWTLYYFGYTFCPDVCPTSLAYLGESLKRLSPLELDRLRVVFVTVDPDRDGPEKMLGYVQHFHPKIEPLWGSAEQVASMAGKFSVTFEKHQEVGKDYYTMDHSSFTTLTSPYGEIVATFAHATDPDKMAERLRTFLGQRELPPP